VASPGSYIRSAAQATFSAYKTLPIRWRLAGGSAALTLVILATFAALVGMVTARQVRGQFSNEVRSQVDELQQQLGGHLKWSAPGSLDCGSAPVHLSDYASGGSAQIQIFDEGSGEVLCTQNLIRVKGVKLPLATPPFPSPTSTGTFDELGYRVIVRELGVYPSGKVLLLYGRRLSDVDHTLARVQFFLLLSVLGGTVLALLAGLWTAQRAMGPIAQLTEAAREIERTRDPSRRLPHPKADDEVAELARTLEGMLQTLDAARNETEETLDRQREFVADASHELRTPLTSVLANLELLAEELDGEQAENAQAALRSTRRMRRIVGDLLLLARADAKRAHPHRTTDLADILIEAASELGPMADDHELAIDARPAVVPGAPDELHRLILNLMENAVRHTPAGTHVRASTAVDGSDAVVCVEDDGPGIPPKLARRVFERFVRGGRDGMRGSGLGLAIVRAVAESHGGTVSLERPASGTGTKFVIKIPAETAAPATTAAQGVTSGNGGGNGDLAAQTSTTTGRTIGRRRSRS
jgi:two-component system, OmpR family, sensor kinase